MPIRILFVDDNERLLRIAHAFIMNLDASLDITTVESAKKALVLLESESFDAIISDYQMPIMDGIQFLEEVRKRDDNIPFIMFTGRSREEIAIQALNLGATQYVTKGGDPKSQYTELIHIVRSAVKYSRAKAALRESEILYRTILDNVIDGIFIVDIENRLAHYANSAMCEMLGYTYSEILQLGVNDIHPPDDLSDVIEAFKKQTTREVRVAERIPMLRKDGTVFFADVSAVPIKLVDKDYQLGAFRDITERIESEERYRALYENLADGLVSINTDGIITMCNEKIVDMFGFKVEDVVGTPFTKYLHPDYIGDTFDVFQRGIEQKRVREKGIEAEGIRRDGTTFYFHLSASLIFHDDEITGFQCLIRDISDRRDTEEELRKQKDELSKFAHSMAHDLRSNLHAIIGYAGLLKEDYTPSHADEIMKIADKIDSLLTRSLALADAGMVIGTPEGVDMCQLVEEVASTTLPDSMRLDCEPMPLILCDREKMSQVIQNILTNAVEHGNANLIQVNFETTEEGIAITISNDGHPIPSELREKIFEMGFTTKEHGGLGLNIIMRIIEAHGWDVSLDPTEITVFRIVIPRESVVFE